MSNVRINSISGFNDLVMDLKSEVTSSLTSSINSVISTLNNTNNYTNDGFSANVGDIANTIKDNLNNILTNITNSEDNIFNYAQFINEFNADDYNTEAKKVDLESQYNNLYVNKNNNQDKESDNYSDDSDDDSGSSSWIDYSNNNVNNTDSTNNVNNSLENYLAGISGTTVVTASTLEPSSTAITSVTTNTQSLSIINNVVYDQEGFAKFGERYVISTNATYGQVGDLIDISQSDGLTLKCIIGDVNQNNSSISFITSQNTNVSLLHPNWLKSITSVKNKGNYFGYKNM